MKIKKYVASTMKDAMQKIRQELGADAVILSSKEVKKGGILGFFQTKQYEVVAALEKQPKYVATPKTVEKQAPKQLIDEEQNEEILNELKQMRKLLATNTFQGESLPPIFQEMYEYLCKQDVEASISKVIIELLIEKHPDVAKLDHVERYEVLRQMIEELLYREADGVQQNNPKIIQFVGPTGVGKTTTLAKIAALTMLEEKKKVAFITTDTYRIAAIDQLKTYARILDVPVEVAYSIEDYRQAIQTFHDYDVIFVDTAGRNFRDDRYVKELQRMLQDEQELVMTYLVLSLTAKNSDIIDIFEQFKSLNVEQVIFTKMDETTTYGSVLNLLWDSEVKVAYMTNGQNVPEDIVVPTVNRISKLIISREAHE